MLQFIASHRNGIDREKLLATLGYDDGCRLPENLVEKGLVRRTDDAYRLTGDATVRMVRLGFDEEALEDKLHDFKCTDKQKAVLRLRFGERSVLFCLRHPGGGDDAGAQGVAGIL